MINRKVLAFSLIFSMIVLSGLVRAELNNSEHKVATSSNKTQGLTQLPQVRGTLYGSQKKSVPAPSYSAYPPRLVFPRPLDSDRGINPWTQNREMMSKPSNLAPKMPKGNPWAAHSLEQLEQPLGRNEKNPYTEKPEFGHKTQRSYQAPRYEPRYNSTYPMPFNEGYYSKQNSFPSPFDESFWPGNNQLWPGGNNNSFPFMPW